jgi:hypothetical protein
MLIDRPQSLVDHPDTHTPLDQVKAMHLSELAADEVDVSAIFILPIRVRGAANSPVRPIAIGSPARRERVS